MKKKDYFNKLELKSNLEVKNKIEKVLIIKNKYFAVKTFNEISVYLIKSNKLKFKISLNEDSDTYRFFRVGGFYFDLNYKLRLINKEDNLKKYKLITDKHLIEIDFNKNEWNILNVLKKGIYIFNLDILIIDSSISISDKKGKLKKEIKELNDGMISLYEIKDKYLIINTFSKFRILDINNNYEILYSKNNCFYAHGYKHPYILDDQTIIFSTILNPYIPLSETYIFLDLNNFTERLVLNIPYDDNDYDSINKLFIIHRFEKDIYLQYEVTEHGYNQKGKKWSIVKENNNKLSFIKKFDDKNILGNFLHFLPDNLIIAWNFLGKNIRFIHYD